ERGSGPSPHLTRDVQAARVRSNSPLQDGRGSPFTGAGADQRDVPSWRGRGRAGTGPSAGTGRRAPRPRGYFYRLGSAGVGQGRLVARFASGRRRAFRQGDVPIAAGTPSGFGAGT